MDRVKTSMRAIFRLESQLISATSQDEIEEIEAEMRLLRQTSYSASIFYTLREINNRFPLLFPLIAIAVVLKVVV